MLSSGSLPDAKTVLKMSGKIDELASFEESLLNILEHDLMFNQSGLKQFNSKLAEALSKRPVTIKKQASMPTVSTAPPQTRPMYGQGPPLGYTVAPSSTGYPTYGPQPGTMNYPRGYNVYNPRFS